MVKKNKNATIGIVIGILMVLLGIFILNDNSFPLIGIAIVILAISIRSYIVNSDLFQKDKK